MFQKNYESELAGANRAEYDEIAARMDHLAQQEPGFLGIRSVRGAEHAQAAGKTASTRATRLRVARVERRRTHP